MAINLFEASYVPTIFLRNAELRAVEELPEHTKDELTPIFCLKPWATTKHLEGAISKIEAVFGSERPYFLDIDPFYEVAEVKRHAQEEFLELIDPEDGSSNWVEFFRNHPNAFPCLQVNHGNVDDVRYQTEQFTEMERVFLVRLVHGGGSGRNWREVVEAVCETEHTNFGFVIDLEWSRDILSRAEWANRLVEQIVDLKGDSVPIILSGSSFPDSFTQYENGGEAALSERLVYNNLRANNNLARIVYGDWASSRSPSEPKPIKHAIPPRIDLPGQQSWEFFRFREEDGGFQIAADTARRSRRYPADLAIWGTYAIEVTAEGTADEKDPALIRHHSKAAAARINIHLYLQQNFDNFSPAPDTDDDFPE